MSGGGHHGAGPASGPLGAHAIAACGACGVDNRAHRGYCRACGAALAPVCRGCRFVNERGDQFCGGCGSALVELPAASAAPAAVLRHGAVSASELLGVTPSGGSGRPRAGRRGEDASALLRGDSELAALFAPAVAATPSEELPSTNITQADLDKLFGAKP